MNGQDSVHNTLLSKPYMNQSVPERIKTEILEVIGQALGVMQDEITNITVLKKGMTNRSFMFSACGKKYIMRIPGEGTGRMVNRKEEAAVYDVLQSKNICDDVIYINPDNGYKISEFMEGARTCDPRNVNDLKVCMKKLRDFHEMKLKVDHRFDIFAQIQFYESLWKGKPSLYRDYMETKDNILSLREYIDGHKGEEVLTHIDAIPDNFLLVEGKDRLGRECNEKVRLIDWEYAGMQDPHLDIAMFCIYSLYNRKEVDRLINIYFNNNCPNEIIIKIYCYIAIAGLLWSNWCEYKRCLGVEFGEYSLRQFQYAKEYYKIAVNKLG